MYSKSEAAAIRKSFWTSFGLYMKPNLSVEYQEINWINYPTEVKGIEIKMIADQKQAYLFIELKPKDVSMKNLMYDQFLEFKTMFENELGTDWIWDPKNFNDFGQERAIIKSEVLSFNIYNKTEWEIPFNFFKEKLILFDVFWENPKEIFKDFLK